MPQHICAARILFVEMTYTASFDGVQPSIKVNDIADRVAAERDDSSSANSFDFETYVRHF